MNCSKDSRNANRRRRSRPNCLRNSRNDRQTNDGRIAFNMEGRVASTQFGILAVTDGCHGNATLIGICELALAPRDDEGNPHSTAWSHVCPKDVRDRIFECVTYVRRMSESGVGHPMDAINLVQIPPS